MCFKFSYYCTHSNSSTCSNRSAPPTFELRKFISHAKFVNIYHVYKTSVSNVAVPMAVAMLVVQRKHVRKLKVNKRCVGKTMGQQINAKKTSINSVFMDAPINAHPQALHSRTARLLE